MRAAFADGQWEGRLTLTVDRGGHRVRVTAGADKDAQARRVRCDAPLGDVLPMQCSLLRAGAHFVGSGMPALKTGDTTFDAAFNLRGLPEFLVRAGLNDAARQGLLRHADVLSALDIEDGRLVLSIDARRASPDVVAALVQIQTRLIDDLRQTCRALSPEQRAAEHVRLEADLAAARATRRRGSMLVAALTIAFVLALLGGVAVLFVRPLP